MFFLRNLPWVELVILVRAEIGEPDAPPPSGVLCPRGSWKHELPHLPLIKIGLFGHQGVFLSIQKRDAFLNITKFIYF